MSDDITVVHGRVFCVTDQAGDVDTARHADHGLYAHETRHLARWALTVDGVTPQPLSAERGSSWVRVLAVPPAGRHHGPACTVRRERYVDDDGLVEEVTLTSHARDDRSVDVHLAVDTDVADLFEVRGMAPARDREVTRTAADGRLGFSYARGTFTASSTVTSTVPAEADATGMRWRVTLPSGGTWTTRVTVRTRDDAAAAPAATPCATARTEEADSLAAFGASAPALHTDWDDLARCWDQSLRDLAALRVAPPGRPDLRVPAAGLPWFCTLFGRDSLLTAWFALPYLPDLARDTLHALAALQGTTTDPTREEEPGKIVHEIRDGEVATCDDLPYGRYYGTVDATPLFLVLLDAYHAATGDDATAHALAPAARAALAWVTGTADAHGGYLTYAAHGEDGLANQCWKDSPTSIAHPDGTLATGPIAVAEAQGYAYAAYTGTARLARDVWHDTELAGSLDARARELRAAFARDFWLDDLAFPALALDGEGRPVRTVASNAGHLLVCGILGDTHAHAVAERLVAPDMFSGWGLRTLAAGEVAYHPLEYHCGSVWPHDTAMAVAGLARHGHHDHAVRLARGLVEAAAHLGYRLPEVFAGYARDETGVPVGYPTACSPQAWAAATPLLLVTALAEPTGRDPDGGAAVRVAEPPQGTTLSP